MITTKAKRLQPKLSRGDLCQVHDQYAEALGMTHDEFCDLQGRPGKAAVRATKGPASSGRLKNFSATIHYRENRYLKKQISRILRCALRHNKKTISLVR
jgi:hypothetical protein